MARVIKFRGKVDGKWRYSTPDDNVWGQFWALVDRETVGQFIGEKSKRGTEIYEGDMVFSDYAGHPKRKLVRWSDMSNEWGVRGYGFILHDGANEVEVIGNVHDTPDLLSGEEQS